MVAVGVRRPRDLRRARPPGRPAREHLERGDLDASQRVGARTVTDRACARSTGRARVPAVAPVRLDEELGVGRAPRRPATEVAHVDARASAAARAPSAAGMTARAAAPTLAYWSRRSWSALSDHGSTSASSRTQSAPSASHVPAASRAAATRARRSSVVEPSRNDRPVRVWTAPGASIPNRSATTRSRPAPSRARRAGRRATPCASPRTPRGRRRRARTRRTRRPGARAGRAASRSRPGSSSAAGGAAGAGPRRTGSSPRARPAACSSLTVTRPCVAVSTPRRPSTSVTLSRSSARAGAPWPAAPSGRKGAPARSTRVRPAPARPPSPGSAGRTASRRRRTRCRGTSCC